VRARIEPAYAVHFLANISLVLRLRICGRVEKKFVDDICNLLKSAECKEVLQAGTTSKDKAVRRISFQLAAEADPSTRAAIIFAAQAHFHVRRNALTLVLHTDKWKKVPVLLKACADKDARISEQAARALHAWLQNYNSSFAEPTREDFQKISHALSQFESSLPHGFAAELRACLKIYFK
jgi:hypothetical protein